jgi:hypothetical protein
MSSDDKSSGFLANVYSPDIPIIEHFFLIQYSSVETPRKLHGEPVSPFTAWREKIDLLFFMFYNPGVHGYEYAQFLQAQAYGISTIATTH